MSGVTPEYFLEWARLAVVPFRKSLFALKKIAFLIIK
jgi:hypothetical protein